MPNITDALREAVEDESRQGHGYHETCPGSRPRGKLLQEDRPDVYGVELIHLGIKTSLPGDLLAANSVSKIEVESLT